MKMPEIARLIGSTPTVEIEWEGRVLICKLEMYNPSGSVKDRAAAAMLSSAISSGRLKEGGSIIEPTSGNTGISLAMLGAAMGVKTILAMPDNMSAERRKMMTAYGAELLLTPAREGMAGSIKAAKEFAGQNNAFMPMQFENPANVSAHAATAAELVRQTVNFDAFVACVGSGGTFTGVARQLKKTMPRAKLYAAEPAESAVLSGKAAAPHGIQGIGAGFVPKIMDLSLAAGVLTVSTESAKSAAAELARQNGISCGISSGAAFEAMKQAAMLLPKGSRIAGIFPDSGDRYLSL